MKIIKETNRRIKEEKKLNSNNEASIEILQSFTLNETANRKHHSMFTLFDDVTFVQLDKTHVIPNVVRQNIAKVVKSIEVAHASLEIFQLATHVEDQQTQEVVHAGI